MLFLKCLGFFSLLAPVLGSPHTYVRDQRYQSPSMNATAEYDYIVIGSGAGGGPLAARLARGGYKVLLLDAGDDQGNTLQQMVPALQLQSTEYEPQSWNFYIQHYTDLNRQEEDSKMTYRTPTGELHKGPNPPVGSEPLGILYPRAGTLGGCTAHNAMVTVYPYESDWDNLAALTGNDSWAADKMRGYYRRLELNRYAPNDTISHGYRGWLQTALAPLNLVLSDKKILSLVIAAGTAAGKNLAGKAIDTVTELAQILVHDANSGTRNRTPDLYQLPIAVQVPDYKRSGPRDFLIETAAQTDNKGKRSYHLDIHLTTFVTNLVFDTSGSRPRATGVDYIKGKSLYRADPRSDTASPGVPGSVYAAKEVIVSGGAFNTPQLLKLSGIGPKAELDKWDIPTLVDLPGVGTNLQDRYETSVIGKSPIDFSLISQCTFLEALPDPCFDKWKYELHDKGAYVSNNIPMAIIRKSSVAENDEPDLLISGAPANFQGYFSGYSSSSWNDVRHWGWVTLKTRSRNNAGTVQLRSADPLDTPIINFHSFDNGVTVNEADQKDLQAVYEAFEFSRSIFKNLVPLDGGFEETWPGPNVTTEAEIKDYIKREAWGHHACCTAPIGADEDPMAVLDGDFRVRGVDGLRVVDASVFPRIPGFYLALPTYMISEKAADVILGDA
ncbi:hypothetical protein EYZ11_010092 [Aspergillus tanneri]|uniref:Glucose-methanol-choline oxidoreductase N-terminal domain-containing protein n=1 Tax=Aspergillus tanneri TaxID=1220188 RepID=A0A4S3J691_9EURO|nr:uncharacterized protein ATNIH1004_002166 [Aspergillus tanneri]KAA8649495.1 hypothetical protein ATNIH1004_002166 [Aspergillus tanneri]THC90450.1 hypothetical protein EYZ11_010092 [Aspergillus tanneri]